MRTRNVLIVRKKKQEDLIRYELIVPKNINECVEN